MTTQQRTSAIKHLQTTLEVAVMRRKYYAESAQEAEEGKKVAWCSNDIPTEILHAMDINAVFLENFATVCASKRLASAYCQIGEQAGFSRDVCGYARICFGYMVGGPDAPEPPYGGIPMPDFCLVSSSSCDSRMGWLGTTARYLNVPLYVLDRPYQPEGSCWDLDNAVYTESQLRKFVAFLEEQTGTRLDPDRLRERFEISRRSRDIQVEVSEMRKAVPSPMTAGDAYTIVWPSMYLSGTQECDDFYGRLRAELQHRIDNKIGIVPEEKFRLLWSGLPPWYNMLLMNYFEDFGGLVAIENAYFRSQRSLPPQDPDPIKDMALRYTQQRTYAGSIGQRVELTLDVVRDYSIDGVILAFNPSCRWFYILQPALKRGLDEAGIPNLALEIDMADERTFSEGQVKTRLDAFIEVMLNKYDARQRGSIT